MMLKKKEDGFNLRFSVHEDDGRVISNTRGSREDKVNGESKARKRTSKNHFNSVITDIVTMTEHKRHRLR